MSAAGAVLASAPYEPALTVHFLGSTASTRKSEHDNTSGMKRACRHTNGVRDDEQSCGRQVVLQKVGHHVRAAHRITFLIDFSRRRDCRRDTVLYSRGGAWACALRDMREPELDRGFLCHRHARGVDDPGCMQSVAQPWLQHDILERGDDARHAACRFATGLQQVRCNSTTSVAPTARSTRPHSARRASRGVSTPAVSGVSGQWALYGLSVSGRRLV